ncbi:MAG: hypothetical protein JNM94_06590 [Phycisphaerae bacterium]|nr:hypothetical protein [Phycisphaerae bacterium]
MLEPLPCPACGYDMRATADIPRCPECGLAIDVRALRARTAMRAWRLTLRNSQLLTNMSLVIAAICWIAAIAIALAGPQAPVAISGALLGVNAMLAMVGLTLLAFANLGVNLPPKRHMSNTVVVISVLQLAAVLLSPACFFMIVVFPPILVMWAGIVSMIPLVTAIGLIHASHILSSEWHKVPITAGVVMLAAYIVMTGKAIGSAVGSSFGRDDMIWLSAAFTLATAALPFGFASVRRHIDRFESDLSFRHERW